MHEAYLIYHPDNDRTYYLSTLSAGNNRTARVFELAWEKYSQVEDPYEKSLPGKDQVPASACSEETTACTDMSNILCPLYL